MQLFYNANLDNSYKQFFLTADESRHLIKVMRRSAGDQLQITNGKGLIFTAEVLEADPRKCKCQIIEEQKVLKPKHALHLVVAPTKNNDRFEWFLEKATELGVDEITPIICKKSERKVIKPERLNKILIAAMKQSLKAYLPQLKEAVSWKEFMQQKFNTDRFIAHCGEGRKTPLKQWIKPQQDVMILIGPEGDFSDTEIREAMSSGFVPVSLGKSRLRTETAAVAACHVINLTNE